MSTPVNELAARLSYVLRHHWLTSVECHHERKTDTAHCFCTTWASEEAPSVGAAVDAWIEHVVAHVVAGLSCPWGEGLPVRGCVLPRGHKGEHDFRPLPLASAPAAPNNTPMKTSLNDYARECHEANKKWWVSIEDGVTPLERNKGEMICLMHSELSEAMEGERKNLMDDKLPHRRMAEVELVDCLIRIFDYAGAFGYDLEGAYEEKMQYNAQREDHKHEARALAGGKKW